MNIRKITTRFAAKSFVALLISVFVASMLAIPTVSAENPITWEGWTKSKNVTKGQTDYQDVTNASPNDVVQVMLWHHNRENPAGPLANNVNVKFVVPNTENTSHIITGISSADNAPTISDPTTVNTAPDTTTVEFISGSAKYRYNKGAADGNPACETGFNYPPDSCYATVSLPDSIVTTGVNLDTYRGGPLRGCNAHHETVIIQVKVKKHEQPVKMAVCKNVAIVAYDKRRVTAAVNGTVQNGQIVDYEIDWGDGNKSNAQSAEHTYSADGTYKIVTRFKVKFSDGEERWVTSDSCQGEVKFEGSKPPVVVVATPPAALPDTGIGSLAGLFMAVSAAATLAYRFVWLRRYNA